MMLFELNIELNIHNKYEDNDFTYKFIINI